MEKKEVAKETAEEAMALKEAVAELSRSFNGQIGKITESIKQCSSKSVKAASDTFSAYPLRSVGIAALCGVMVGFLLSKK